MSKAAAVEEEVVEQPEGKVESEAKAEPDKAEEEAPSIEEIASKIGWVPQEKFKGPVEKWKPAHEFIVDGKDIQERTSRELKEMRQTLDTVARTSGAIMAERLKSQEQELTRKYTEAVDKGDPETAFATASEIMRVRSAASPAVNGPAPETQSWVEKNAKVKADPLAWQRALQVCDAYARAGQPVHDQLANTEAVLKREFPHLFDDKPAPRVNGDISRNSSSPAKNGKTAADLPKEARAAADDLVERGLIKNPDDYAKHYFAAQARKA